MNSCVRCVGAALALCLAVVPQIGAQGRDGLPELDNTGVVVPWSDFKLLLQDLQQAPSPTPAPPPPVAFAYAGCTATATVDEGQERLRLQLAFEVQVMEPASWVSVPVAPAGMALESVVMDGSPARLYRADGHHTVALRGIGRHRFELTAWLAVHERRGNRSVRLRFPQAPAVNLTLSLPRDDLEVELPGAVLRSVTRGDGTTTVQASLAEGRDLELSWFRRVQADAQSPTTFAELSTLYQVGEAVVRGSTTIAVTVHGRGVESFRLSVPAELTILDLSGHGVTSWQLAAPSDSDRRQLDVALNFTVQGAYSFELSFEKMLDGTTTEFELPDIEIHDVLRERGFMAVAAATNVEITPRGELENVAPVDPSELPGELSARAGDAILYAFKYLRHPVVVVLEVVKHGDVAVKRTIVERARLHSFVNPEGRRLSSATYAISNNRKQYLALELPARAVLWGAFRDGEPVKAARRDDGIILVPLQQAAVSRGGRPRTSTVEVVYFEAGRRIFGIGSLEFSAPVLDVDTMELEWVLYLPRDKRYFGFGGNLDELAAANRVALIGGAAYNLGNASDLSLLKMLTRDGQRVLSDGANEVLADTVVVGSAGEERPLSADELAKIGSGAVADAAREDVDEEMQTASRAEGDQQLSELRSQVAISSNVASSLPLVEGGAGAMVGVLPVRFTVPTDGLRLSFGGRLLTDGSDPRLRLRFIPAAWRMPQLGGFWVFSLGFAATLLIGVLMGGGLPGLGRGAWTAVLVALLVLIAVFLMSEGHRSVLWVAMAGAAALCLGLWSLRDRSGMEGF